MKQEEQNKFIIHPLPVLQDNIVWVWVVGKEAVVVDPSISSPVLTWLKAKGLNLIAILQTHHHDDHIGGTQDLLKHWPSAAVVASKDDLDRIPFQTISVINEKEIFLMGYTIKVLDIPGHTRSHIAFYLSEKGKKRKNPALFCGDTLFGGGCGRLFEGTPKEMFTSLNRINSLPPETLIYCAHEYTEANLRWANHLYQEDVSIKRRLAEVITKREKGITSLPSSLREERQTNLFLQVKNIKEFSVLREHKDRWKG